MLVWSGFRDSHPRPVSFRWMAFVAVVWLVAIASAPMHTWADKLYLGTLVFAVVAIAVSTWVNNRRARTPRDQP
jgi:hypothetical protein